MKLVEVKFEELLGKTISYIDGKVGDERMSFKCTDGTLYRLTYYPDCCANCDVNDICGDLDDILGSPITLAELVESNENPETCTLPAHKLEYGQDSFTWAFYKLSTIKGSVTIRWYGSSNGYYSETATFEKEVE